MIGAGGHGRVAADIGKLLGYQVWFLDDGAQPDPRVKGKVAEYKNYLGKASFFVAIGNNKTRKSIIQDLIRNSADIATLVHPGAVIAESAEIGIGSIVMAGAVINPNARIGAGSIINTCSSVDHDCNIGDYVHISVGSHVAGTVTVGDETFIGAGAIIINNLTVCSECVVGAGATVVKNLSRKGTYIGTPAKLT